MAAVAARCGGGEGKGNKLEEGGGPDRWTPPVGERREGRREGAGPQGELGRGKGVGPREARWAGEERRGRLGWWAERERGGVKGFEFFPKPFSNFKLLKLHTSNINIMQPKQHTYIFILFNL
jgi:hypothetical protein